MISIYNINKFVTSCGGGWLIQACRVRVVFASFFLLQVLSAGGKSGDWVFFFCLFFFHFLSICYPCFFPRPPPSLSFTAVVKKQPTFPPVTALSVCYSTCGYWTYERTGGGFRGICGRCLGKNEADGDMKYSLVWSPREEVRLLSAAGEDGAQFLVPSSALRSCWRL